MTIQIQFGVYGETDTANYVMPDDAVIEVPAANSLRIFHHNLPIASFNEVIYWRRVDLVTQVSV
jgi:hypothetical protein